MRSKLLEFGLLYLAACLLFLVAGDLLVAASFRQSSVESIHFSIEAILWGGGLLVFALLAVPVLLQLRSWRRRVRHLERVSRGTAAGDFRLLPVERRSDDELGGLERAMEEIAVQYDRAVRVLTEERNRSETILRSMVEGVAVIEPTQKIAFCNGAFCEALGLKGVPCAGRLLLEVTRQAGLLELVQQALDSRQTARGEFEMGTPPQHVFGATAAPLAGTAHGVVLVLHDISELRKLERMRRDFVANVSHEFKTPLTAIQGFAETLLGGALEDQQHSRHFLEIIRDHAVRLGRVTNDLLKLSSIEAGKLDLRSLPVDVPRLIRACMETDRIRAEQRHLRLAASCPQELPPIQGDPARLQEAVLNLLDNAIQYTPQGGTVKLSASANNGLVVIAVSDTGIGIPKREQHRIFERFYRVDDARSREVGGTGLGLSITKHLVEAHGGRIELESEVGKGSTFLLYLPAGPPAS